MDVILSHGPQITTLQTYGVYGAQILKGEVVDALGDPLDNLTTLLQRDCDQDRIKEQIDILEGVENETSNLYGASLWDYLTHDKYTSDTCRWLGSSN